MSDRGSSVLEIALSFALGTATGFILGVLLAPAPGVETRKKIQETAAKTGEKAKESYARIAKQAELGIQKLKEGFKKGEQGGEEPVEVEEA